MRKQIRSCDGGFAWGDLSPPLASFNSWTIDMHTWKLVKLWSCRGRTTSPLSKQLLHVQVSSNILQLKAHPSSAIFSRNCCITICREGGWRSAMTLTRWDNFIWQPALDLATFEGYVGISTTAGGGVLELKLHEVPTTDSSQVRWVQVRDLYYFQKLSFL